MEQGRDSSKEQAVQHMFMCSKLYVAAFEGRTELVARLLTGSSGLAATAQAMNGTSNLTLQTIFQNLGKGLVKSGIQESHALALCFVSFLPLRME